MLSRLLAAAVALALLPAAPARAELEIPPVSWGNDFSCHPSLGRPRPVVLLHGLFGTGAYNWSRLGPVLEQAGYCVFAPTYGLVPGSAPERDGYRPGGLIDATQSAPEIAAFVGHVLFSTGAAEVDLVGHSEGTVTPRYYLERLGGAAWVSCRTSARATPSATRRCRSTPSRYSSCSTRSIPSTGSPCAARAGRRPR